MAKLDEIFFGQPFSAWQWQPTVCNGCVVWAVGETTVHPDKTISALRLDQLFKTRTEAISLVSQMNNGLDCTQFPIIRVDSDWPLPVFWKKIAAKDNPNLKAKRQSPASWVAQHVDTTLADNLRTALAERGGMWTFTGLYKGQERVPAALKSTLSGPFWRLREPISGRCSVPAGPNSRIQRELGLYEADEVAGGVLKTRREKHLDGGIFLRAWVARTGCKWGSDAMREL